MTEAEQALDLVRRAADDLVPQLTERLERHGLAEIEVARGELRLRVAGQSATRPAAVAATPDGANATSPPSVASAPVSDPVLAADPAGVGVAAPAVGYFVYADGLGPGLEVTKGDALGHVEMLGVRHDVRAPRAGTVRHLVAESGEAVEYGQVVVEIQPPPDAR